MGQTTVISTKQDAKEGDTSWQSSDIQIWPSASATHYFNGITRLERSFLFVQLNKNGTKKNLLLIWIQKAKITLWEIRKKVKAEVRLEKMWVETIQGLQKSDCSNLFEHLQMQAKENDFALLKQKGHFLES